jgi:hypothetical protein
MNTEQLDEEQLYYKNKYLKYKNKYLVFKKQLKGGNFFHIIGEAWDNTAKTVSNAITQDNTQAVTSNDTQSQKLSSKDHYINNNKIINFLVELVLSQFCSNENIKNIMCPFCSNENNEDCRNNNKNCPPTCKTKTNTIKNCPDNYKNNYNETKKYIKIENIRSAYGILDTSCKMDFNELKSVTKFNNYNINQFICEYNKTYFDAEICKGKFNYDTEDFKLYNLSHNLKYYRNFQQEKTALEYLIDQILKNFDKFRPLVIKDGVTRISIKDYLIEEVKKFISNKGLNLNKTDEDYEESRCSKYTAPRDCASALPIFTSQSSKASNPTPSKTSVKSQSSSSASVKSQSSSSASVKSQSSSNASANVKSQTPSIASAKSQTPSRPPSKDSGRLPDRGRLPNGDSFQRIPIPDTRVTKMNTTINTTGR